MSRKTKGLSWIAAGLILAGVAGQVYAQTAPTPPAEMETEEQEVTIGGMWKTGGWAMYPIGLLNIGAIAFTIYGFLVVGDKRMIQSTLVPSVQGSISQLDFRGAGALCSGSPGVFSNIMNAGLIRLGGTMDVEAAEKAMEEAAVEENTSGLRPINYLSIIASISPMFGLLGTVSGMIKAFQKIGLGGMGKPEQLAGNIGEAMITTAYGLIVGIPAMFFYFFLKSKFQQNMARIARVLGNQTHQLKEIRQRVADGELTMDGMTVADAFVAPAVQAAPVAEAKG
ncbi:MAG: MotA/TolQ/ExbB proton channel family protein [Kiritimatiellia bacterium]|nr:MotA/TolQ/ExbB proton channel family protein [Kiritimatiellia bacterium]